jgi:putative FmdB family regulatory protein
MPLYEYRCGKCNHLDELIVPHKSASRRACPACKSRTFVRQFPTRVMLKTETTFHAGRKMLADQFDTPGAFDRHMAACKAQGFTPHQNDHYQAGMARFKADRLAHTPHDNTKAYMKKHCEDNGLECEELGTKSRPQEVVEERLDPALVEEILQDRVAENPEMARKPERLAEERVAIVEKHGAPE